MTDDNNNEVNTTLLIDFLKICKIPCENVNQLSGLQIPREILLSDDTYTEAKKYIPTFKKKFSSSYLTSLQSSAEKIQKWPLLNLLRQILKAYKFKLTPKRLANGYTKTGTKLYRRIFLVEKINPPPQ